jgi:hypothetical protein
MRGGNWSLGEQAAFVDLQTSQIDAFRISIGFSLVHCGSHAFIEQRITVFSMHRLLKVAGAVQKLVSAKHADPAVSKRLDACDTLFRLLW